MSRKFSASPFRGPYAMLTCLLLCGAAALAQKVNLPAVTRANLPNGIHVILMEYHRAPFLNVIAEFEGGDAAQPAGRAGVADLTATLLRRGSATRTAQQIAEQIDYLGGSLDTGSGNDSVSVSVSTLSRNADAGLDLLADVIRHPTFPAEELERERQLALSGLQSLGEDPGAVAARVADETVYRNHPYGLEPTVTTLKAITRDDVVAYYDHSIAPNRMILVAVGDFHTQDMIERLKAHFADWPRRQEAMPALPAIPAKVRRNILIDKPDATQTQVRWIRPAIPRNSADYIAAVVASTILGGGFTSRLTDEIRVNRSLTYGISSDFAGLRSGGDFEISTFTKVDTTRALLDATTAVLRRTAQQGFTLQELQKVKGYLTGLFAIQAQTPEALARRLADIALYRLPDNTLDSYPAQIRAVTLPQVNRMAQIYFAPESLSLILVAPASQVKSQLAKYGDFETHPVDTIGK
jgi:zinc protease